MKKNTLGRNDLCHCGSGKKYKNCCLELDEMLGTDDDLFERYNRLITTCKLKLDQEFGTNIKKIRHDLLRHFMWFAATTELPTQNESLFSDWLWFDLLDSDENPFAYNYLNNQEHSLQQPLQECMGALMLSYLSVYEPIEVQDKHLKVKDIFTEKENAVLLKEPFEGDIQSQPMLLLGRQLHFQEESVFSGMVLVINEDNDQKDFILKHMHYLQHLHQDGIIVNTLKFNPEILYGVFDHAYHKNYLPLADAKLYNITSEEKTSLKDQSLASSFEFDYDAGQVQWYSVPDQQNYLKIGLAEDHLLCCADMIADIEWLEHFTEEALPGRESQILQSRFLQQQPDDDLIFLWFEVIKDRECERWLHSPHTELNGKTPLEVMNADTKDLEQVLQMLDTFAERASDRPETQDLINHMRMRVQQL
ncbi:MAG: SEC-C metal-binding domain-containing protein [Bacillota bacterium]|nr:SEC-C metal-binding domain-containing protein [Bacillota bacterium]